MSISTAPQEIKPWLSNDGDLDKATADIIAGIRERKANPPKVEPLSPGLMAAAGRFHDRAGSAYSRAVSRLADGES